MPEVDIKPLRSNTNDRSKTSRRVPPRRDGFTHALFSEKETSDIIRLHLAMADLRKNEPAAVQDRGRGDRLGACPMKTHELLVEMEKAAEAMTLPQIIDALRGYQVAVVDIGEDGYLVVEPNVTRKGLAHVLASLQIVEQLHKASDEALSIE